jgi:hypothetical protein
VETLTVKKGTSAKQVMDEYCTKQGLQCTADHLFIRGSVLTETDTMEKSCEILFISTIDDLNKAIQALGQTENFRNSQH